MARARATPAMTRPRAQPAPPHHPPAVAHLLDLQRLAGNRAVASLLQREAAPAPGGSPGHGTGTGLTVGGAIAMGEAGKPAIYQLSAEDLAPASVEQRTTIIGWVLTRKFGLLAGGLLGGDSDKLLLNVLASTPDAQGAELVNTLEAQRYTGRLHDFIDGAANVGLHEELSRLKTQRFAQGKVALEPPPTLPWNDTWVDSVTFKSQPVPGAKVRIVYPQNLSDQVQTFKRPTAFTKEFTALPRDIFGIGHLYPADQPVLVHDHARGKTVPMVASELGGIEARGVREFVHRAELTTAAGLTLGLAGPAGAAAVEGAAATETAAAGATGAATLWSAVSGPIVSAISSVVVNVSGQLMEYHDNWEKWNFKSIAFDAVVSVIGGELAAKVAKVIPVKLGAAKDLADPTFLKNFAHQQAIFFLYGNAVAAIKNLYRKSDSEKAASAAAAEQAVSALKSVGSQSYLATPGGMERFPGGLKNPKWRVIDKIFSVIANGLIQVIYGTTPKK